MAFSLDLDLNLTDYPSCLGAAMSVLRELRAVFSPLTRVMNTH